MEQEDEEQKKNKQKAAAIKAKKAESAVKNKEADIIGAKDAEQLVLRENTNYDYSTTARQKRQNRTSDWVASEATPTLSAKAVSSEADYTPAAQKRKQATSDQVYENVLKGEAYLQSPTMKSASMPWTYAFEEAAKGFANRLRSAGGETVENIAYALDDNIKDNPEERFIDSNFVDYLNANAKNVVAKNTAGQIGNLADAQFANAKENTGVVGDFAIDAADTVANMLSQQILAGVTRAPFAAVQGISSGAQKYRDTREAGGSKEEALQRGVSTGAVAGVTEALLGIGGTKIGKQALSKIPGVNKVVTVLDKAETKNWITKVFATALEEGGEEALEYVFEYASDVLADQMYKGEIETDFDVSELFRNALLGAVTGAGFGTIGATADTYNNIADAKNNPKVVTEPEVKAEAPKAPVEPPVVEAENNTPKAENEQEGTFANAEETKKALEINESKNNIDINDELSKLNVKSVNDYVGTQKAVLKKLNSEGFFTENNKRNDTNKESGIVVKTDVKSIEEMFSTGKRFQTLPRELKNLKLASIGSIPNIIKNGTLIGESVAPYHNKQKKQGNVRFAYIESPITINGKTYYAVVGAKHTQSGYHAWTLEIRNESKKNSPSATANAITQNAEGFSEVAKRAEESIAQNNNIVNEKSGTQAKNIGAQDGAHPNTVGGMESNPKSFSYAQNNYGTYPEGENATKVVDMPVSTDGENRVNRFGRTEMEAGVTPESLIPNFEKAVENGDFSYNIETDKKALDYAKDRIIKYGFEKSVGAFEGLVDGEKVLSKKDLVFGEMLYAQAAQSGDAKTAMQLASALAQEFTKAGQAVQAARILKKLSPEGRLYNAQKLVDRFNNKDNKPKGQEEITIDEKLATDLLSAQTEAEIESAEEAIKQNIADQIVATKMDKWNAWRYLSMLGNPKTHIRNVLGNAMFVPARVLKNVVKANIENAYAKTHKDYVKTTTTEKTTEAQKKAATESFERNAKQLASGGNYRYESELESKQTIFKNKVLEAARKANNNALEAEDMFFLKRAYEDSFAKYLRANNIDPAKATAQQITAAENYAQNEAWKATYRDASKVATAFEKFSESRKGIKFFADAFIPFRKTPINILARGVEYSPIELVKAVTYDVAQVKNGKMEAQEMIDHISSGITGTGIVALGAWLASMGLVSGGDDENDKIQNFEELQGKQNYALQIDDYSYTLDWAAPVSMPLFVGVELYNALSGKGFDGGDVFSAVIDAVGKTADPMIGLSMLQNIESVLSGNYGGEGNGFWNLVKEAGMSYVLQIFPTLGSQIAQTIDPNRRNAYYVDKTNNIGDWLELPLNRILSKIPGASMFLPERVDEWGRTEKQEENVALRIFENFASPGYISKKNSTKVDETLKQLYANTGNASVLPTSFAKNFEIKGETKNLSSKEYVEASKTKGQTSYKMLEQLVTDPAFKNLSPEQQAKIISDVYSYSTVKGKQAVSNYTTDTKWYSNMEDAKKEADISNATFLVAKNKYSNIETEEGGRSKDLQMLDYLIADNKTDAKQDLVLMEKVAGADLSKYKKSSDSPENILSTYDLITTERAKGGDGTQQRIIKQLIADKNTSAKEDMAFVENVLKANMANYKKAAKNDAEALYLYNVLNTKNAKNGETEKEADLALIQKKTGGNIYDARETYAKAKGDWNESVSDVISNGTNREAKVKTFRNFKFSDKEITAGYNAVIGLSKKDDMIAALTNEFGNTSKATTFYNILKGKKGYK